MKDLLRWQFVSFMSRGLAMLAGLIQSFVIVRILTVPQWGVVQLAVAIGGAFGIYQHLGLASGSTREISSAKDATDIFKIFVTAGVIRYAITIPIALFLFLSANSLAVGKYSDPQLILPIKLYAGVLVFQGVQSILNSVISGTKRFKQLFIYQSVIAFVSILIFIPLVYFYKVNGYFYALLAFTLVCSITLAIIAFLPLKAHIVWLSKTDFSRLFKELLSISLAIYFIKVAYTLWEKSGPLLLGLTLSKADVAYFAMALLYGKKLMMISDAVTDVNLPVLSDKFVHDFEEFKALFLHNFNKVFTLIFISSTIAVFWAKEFIHFAVGGSKYDNALFLILPACFAFVFYSLANIVHSSVLIPAKQVRGMVLSYILLLVTTIGLYFGSRTTFGYLGSMAWAMVGGAGICVASMNYLTRRFVGFGFFTLSHWLLVGMGMMIGVLADITDFWLKLTVFLPLISIYCGLFFLFRFMTKSDINTITTKFKKKVPAL